jgi:hypothetical protein
MKFGKNASISATGLDPVWMTFGMICTGLSIIWVLNTMVGVKSISFASYGIVAWAWIRAVNIMFHHLISWIKDDGLRFAIAWFLPLGIIIILGLFHIPIPIFLLSLIGLVDLITRIIFDIRKHWLVILKSTIAGSLIAVFMIKIIIEEHYPWMDALSPAGIGFIDNYRDAAIVMAWHNYGSLSHGVHGLMFEAYHSLSAIFISPFLSENFGVFSVFVFFSFVAIPTLIFYGVAMILKLAPAKTVSQNWPFITIAFLFLISQFDLVSTQSSLMIATLLMIGTVPSLAQIWFQPEKSSIGSVLILAVILPLVIFSRVFNGLIFLSLFIPLIFVLKDTILRIIFLLSVGISIAIVIFFFGSTVRAENTYFMGFFEYLLRGGYGAWWFLSGWLFVLLPIVLFFKFRALHPMASYKSVIQDPIFGPVIYVCIVTLLLLFRASSSTDAIYQSIPAFFIMFFIVFQAPVRLIRSHFPTGGIVDGLCSKGVVYCVALAVFLSVYVENENQIEHKLNFEEYLLLENVKEIRTHFGEDFSFSDRSQCSGIIARHVCNLDPNMFSGFDINQIASISLPARLARSALKKAKSVDGVTGVYISPEHRYWAQEYYRPVLPSLYFMSVVGIPMVFGAQEHIRQPAYSILSAHLAKGTLVPLSDFSGIYEFCKAAQLVKVDNVVVFEANDEEGDLIQCNNEKNLDAEK